jgi:SET domain-containing protein
MLIAFTFSMSTGPQEVLYVIRQSSIHSRGVFAARDIRKGERVIEYLGEKITKAESERRASVQLDESSRAGEGAVYIFTLNKRHDLDGNVEWNPARLINHSCNPNCEADVIRGRIWILAKRAIKEGEELSYDYGFDLDSWQDHPCLCGEEKCAGYIVARRHWPKLRRLIRERDACVDGEKSGK